MIRYKIGDLFEKCNDYDMAHCISSDFALGQGIAVLFNKKFDLRKRLKLFSQDKNIKHPDCIVIHYNGRRIFNLITKEKYWNKPTIKSMKIALTEMKEKMDCIGITKLSMPMIGSGLDRLKWNEVEEILKKLFSEDKYDIIIYKLK